MAIEWTICGNLPGWPWAMITKVALDRLSRSLHSDVCDSDRCRDAVAYSRISGRGSRRNCAVPNIWKIDSKKEQAEVGFRSQITHVRLFHIIMQITGTAEHRRRGDGPCASTQKGCAERIAPVCTLSQNGYGN